MIDKPFMTYRQYCYSFLLALFMLIATFSIVYLEETITVPCVDGTEEKYFKSELHLQKEICGGVNYYKYNDNTGLGAYFPDKEAVNKVKLGNEVNKNLELNITNLELYFKKK